MIEISLKIDSSDLEVARASFQMYLESVEKRQKAQGETLQSIFLPLAPVIAGLFVRPTHGEDPVAHLLRHLIDAISAEEQLPKILEILTPEQTLILMELHRMVMGDPPSDPFPRPEEKPV